MSSERIKVFDRIQIVCGRDSFIVKRAHLVTTLIWLAENICYVERF